MITFSFRPSRRSVLPSSAASVSTLVVSWNEAADRNESVASDALVMPRMISSIVAFSFLPLWSSSFVDALRLVDLLYLVDEVQLGRRAAADVEHLGRVDRALVELRAAVDLVALRDEETRTARERVAVLLAVVERDDHLALLLGVLDRDDAALGGQLREALRLTRLEQLHDARQ